MTNRKKPATRPETETPEPIDTREEEQTFIKKPENEMPDFYGFFREQLTEAHDYEIKLYRCEEARNGKMKKWYLKSYYNEIPELEEIGNDHGGGQFWLVSNDPFRKGEHLDCFIYIDHIFTRKKRQREDLESRPQVDPLAHMERMIQLLKPILELTGTGRRDNPAQEMPKYIESMTNTFLQGIQKMQMAMVNTKLEALENAKTNQLENADEERNNAQALNWIREILNFTKPFLNSFLTAKGPAKEIMQNIITSDKRFKEITEDEQLFSMLYSAGISDPEIGKLKMDKLFKDCGFEVPGEEPDQTINDLEPEEEPAK